MTLAGGVLLVAALANASPQRLRIGYGYVPPITFHTPNNRPAGFAVDVLNEAARRAGVQLDWERVGTSRSIEQKLVEGKLDLVPAGMITPYRQRVVYVSEPWWFAELTLVAPAASGIEAGSQLGGKRLALGSPIYSTLLSRYFPPLTPVPYSASDDAVNAVCNGEANAALITHSELREFIMGRPGACKDTALFAVNTSADLELAVIANRKSEAAARRLRARIDDMALDGTLAALAARHPALPSHGAVRLADALRTRYERRTLRVTILSTAALLILAALYLFARIRSQRKLALSEERYRTFFQHAAVGTAEIDPQGRFVNVNEKCCEILGHSRSQLLGRAFYEIAHADDRALAVSNFRSLTSGEVPSYNRERRYVRLDGTFVWVRVAAAAVRDRSGRMLYAAGVVQDVSARKQAEEALRHSEERYRMLVEANPVGVAFASLSGSDYGRLYKVNQSYADIVGYTRQEIESGQVRWTDLTPPEWAGADRLAIEETFRDGHSNLFEKEYIRKDGSRIPVLMATAAAGSNGEAVAFVLDVSDRKRLEREVKWLTGLLPICASCKKVRDEDGNWQPVDTYMHRRISADFTHGLCPTCVPLYSGKA